MAKYTILIDLPATDKDLELAATVNGTNYDRASVAEGIARFLEAWGSGYKSFGPGAQIEVANGGPGGGTCTVTYSGVTSGNITFTLCGSQVTQAFTTDNNTTVGLLAAACAADAVLGKLATYNVVAGNILVAVPRVQNSTLGLGYKFSATAATGSAVLAPVGGFPTGTISSIYKN